MKIADFPWGWIGTKYDNEVEIVSTKPDPPKVRLAVEAGQVESNLGSISFNLRRPDGEHEEYGYVMGRLTADKQAGALYIGLRPQGEPSCREVLYLDSSGAHFRVPIVAPGLGITVPPAPAPNELVSPSGAYRLSLQDDGNFVIYRMTSEGGKAVWARCREGQLG